VRATRTRVLVVDDTHVQHGLNARARARAVLHPARVVREHAEQPHEVALEPVQAARGAARAGHDDAPEHEAREEDVQALQDACGGRVSLASGRRAADGRIGPSTTSGLAQTAAATPGAARPSEQCRSTAVSACATSTSASPVFGRRGSAPAPASAASSAAAAAAHRLCSASARSGASAG
jgi:hypothetical protein